MTDERKETAEERGARAVEKLRATRHGDNDQVVLAAMAVATLGASLLILDELRALADRIVAIEPRIPLDSPTPVP